MLETQIKLSIKEYSEKAAGELLKVLVKGVQVSGDGEFQVVASTNGVDRDGEIIQIEAWDLANYMKNPVVLFGHDYWSMPIGAVTDLKFENNQLIASGVFARTECAQECRQLYDDGILRAVSVGFIVRERNIANPAIITKAELLEISFVPVPSNPDALTTAKLANVKKLFTKSTEPEAPANDNAGEQPANDNGGDSEELTEYEKELQEDKQNGESVNAEAEGDKPEADGENAKAAKVTVKVGRVLSAANREKIQAAIKALQEICDMAEPEKESVADSMKAIQNFLRNIDKEAEKALVEAKKTLNL